jgi:SNF2 family DNA or RNA helicase
LAEDVEAANGNPILVFYWFKHDLARIKAKLKEYKPVELKTSEQIKQWNAGKIPVLLLHPASAAHGLNLQYGGHLMTWFGPIWSLELWQQAIARLFRQGQTKPVICRRYIVAGTIHESTFTFRALLFKTHSRWHPQ